MMSDNALPDRDFRGILIEACRSESGDVGVGWGKDWGKRSRSDWLTSTPGHGAGDSVKPDRTPKCFTEVSGREILGS